jgi:hypothetical protein
MAYEEGIEAISRVVGADLSAATNVYTGVKDSPTGLVAFAAATDKPAGVLQKPLPKVIGDVARLGVGGISKVKLGGTVANGDAIQFNATGKGIVAATGGYVIGTAQSAGVSGDVIPVLINAANQPIK